MKLTRRISLSHLECLAAEDALSEAITKLAAVRRNRANMTDHASDEEADAYVETYNSGLIAARKKMQAALLAMESPIRAAFAEAAFGIDG